jgi:ribonuclease HI
MLDLSRWGRLREPSLFDLVEEKKVSFDLRSLKIYIDGSCRKNPGGSGGFAARIEYPFDWNRPDELLEYRGFFETNSNRMELAACLFALEWILDQGDGLGVQHVQVVTDSKYVYENYNRSIGWSRNGWRNFHDRPVENPDLWKDLLRARRKLGFRLRVEVKLIAGKSTPITKAVDRDAKTASTMPSRVDRGFQSGKIGRSKNNSGKAAKMYPAAGEEFVIRIYQTFVRGNVQKIKFQTFSEEKKDFFDKYVAYAEHTIGNALHRHHVYRVQMNDVSQYPQILEILEELEEIDLVPVRVGAK